MASKQLELIYSQQAGDFIAGRAYSNPRFFTTPRAGVSKVFLVGDWPNIRAAYEAMDVPVERLDPEEAAAPPPGTAKAPESLVPTLEGEARDAIAIPDDWADLSWQKKRSLASSFSDTPILNGAQAAEAIEAELRRRRSEETADNGLTRREICCDLEAMGVEYDPSADVNALATLRDEKRDQRPAE